MRIGAVDFVDLETENFGHFEGIAVEEIAVEKIAVEGLAGFENWKGRTGLRIG